MLILKADADGVEVRLTGDELHMLNNALNEVCNGVRELSDDGEFQTRSVSRGRLSTRCWMKLADYRHPLAARPRALDMLIGCVEAVVMEGG